LQTEWDYGTALLDAGLDWFGVMAGMDEDLWEPMGATPTGDGDNIGGIVLGMPHTEKKSNNEIPPVT